MAKRLKPSITIQRCLCGHPSCKDYWLDGVGKFCQGSGFTKLEAERIAELLNEDQVFAHIRELEQ